MHTYFQKETQSANFVPLSEINIINSNNNNNNDNNSGSKESAFNNILVEKLNVKI